MNREEIETAVVESLCTVLKCEVGADCTRENTAAWDSLRHIEVMFAIEDKLGLQFTEEELIEMDGVHKIVDAAMSRHAA